MKIGVTMEPSGTFAIPAKTRVWFVVQSVSSGESGIIYKIKSNKINVELKMIKKNSPSQ